MHKAIISSSSSAGAGSSAGASSAGASSFTASSSAGSLLQDLPVRNPLAFSRLGEPDRAKFAHPAIYIATHDQTEPPRDQVITTEKQNILLRQFHQLAEAKREQQKRSARDAELESSDSKLPRLEAASPRGPDG